MNGQHQNKGCSRHNQYKKRSTKLALILTKGKMLEQKTNFINDVKTMTISNLNHNISHTNAKIGLQSMLKKWNQPLLHEKTLSQLIRF